MNFQRSDTWMNVLRVGFLKKNKKAE